MLSSRREQHSQPYPPPGKTAIITGGATGLGRSTAFALCLSGWNVILLGSHEERLIDVGEEVTHALRNHTTLGGDENAKVGYRVGNATDEEDVRRLFDEVIQKYDRVHLVFCNAGVSPPPVPIEDLPLPDWQATLNANLTAAFLCSREAYRKMKDRGGGRIIINGCLGAHVARPDRTAYTVAKHGLTGLTKSLALDGRKYHISVSQIDFGDSQSFPSSVMTLDPTSIHVPSISLPNPNPNVAPRVSSTSTSTRRGTSLDPRPMRGRTSTTPSQSPPSYLHPPSRAHSHPQSHSQQQQQQRGGGARHSEEGEPGISEENVLSCHEIIAREVRLLAELPLEISKLFVLVQMD